MFQLLLVLNLLLQLLTVYRVAGIGLRHRCDGHVLQGPGPREPNGGVRLTGAEGRVSAHDSDAGLGVGTVQLLLLLLLMLIKLLVEVLLMATLCLQLLLLLVHHTDLLATTTAFVHLPHRVCLMVTRALSLLLCSCLSTRGGVDVVRCSADLATARLL